MQKTSIFLLLCMAAGALGNARAQTDTARFHGAPANLGHYKALYFIDESADAKIRMVIKNINNALDDERLKGKLEVELVAFGPGVEIFKKTNPYDTLLRQLQQRQVLLAECENTLKLYKIRKDELWPFIFYVPSGNGEVIIRGSEGWSVVRP